MFAPGGTKGLETGKNCLVRSSMMSLLTRYHHGDKVKENEMGVVYDRHGGKDNCFQRFGATAGMEDLGVVRMIILK